MPSFFSRKAGAAPAAAPQAGKAPLQPLSTSGANQGAPPPAPPPPPPTRQPGSPTRHLQGQSVHPPWARLRRALAPNPLNYVNSLLAGTLGPATARPSSLQPLLKRGRHRPSSLCHPTLDMSGTQLADLPTDCAGRLAPLGASGSSAGAVAQCFVTLGTVKNVPPSGVAERKPWAHVARACLYDGARFHGSAQAMRPKRVKPGKHGEATWCFDAAAPMLVRCPAELMPRAQLYIEFCVTYELTPEEVARLPPTPLRASRQVDEVCVCWALVSLSTLRTLHTSRSLNVPLMAGPLARRMTLQDCLAAAAAAAAAAPTAGAGLGTTTTTNFASCGVNWSASLPLKLAPVPTDCLGMAAMLPAAAAVVSPTVAKAVGCYRQLLAEALATAEGPTSLAPASDPVLASFPAMLDDADLAHTFFTLWEKATTARKGKGAPPPPATGAQLAKSFRQCAMAVWAVMGAQAVPPGSIANHVAHQTGRQQRIQQFFLQHPAVGLGANAHSWLHKPFDAGAELRCGPLEGLGPTV